MKNKEIFLGICILLASMIISATIIYCVRYNAEKNRYYFTNNNTLFDKWTGKYYYGNPSKTHEVDLIDGIWKSKDMK